jgi:linoleoyl-CoA desaturase
VVIKFNNLTVRIIKLNTMAFTPPRFVDTDKNKSEFYAVLRKRVDGYFKENNISKHATPAMVVKTIVLLALYLGPFAYMMLVPTSIGISYGALVYYGISASRCWNEYNARCKSWSIFIKQNMLILWLGHTLNLAGGSVFNWKIQHNVLHHTYTNIVELDDDIDDKLVLRFSPHTKVKWYHKFQVVYAFLFYGILTLYWAIIKGFCSIL